MATIFSEGIFARFEEQFRPFLAKLEIPESALTRRDVEISSRKFAELLETVAWNTNPYIGLDMGQSLVPGDIGVIGHAMSATSSIGEALAVFSRYLYVLSHSNTIRLDVGEDKVVCTYTVTILQPDLVRQDAEFALSWITTMIRKLSGRNFRPRFIEFSHSQFKSTKRHQSLFDCDIAFEQRNNRIHFSKKVLDYPVLTADPSLLEALIFYLDSRLCLRSEEDDLLAKVRHLISISLGDGLPDMNRIASLLGMSGRTLQRKLRDEKVAFADLVDEIRYAIAQDYISHSEFSLTDVSMMLGYGELSSFSRAFKRWTGSSPDLVRKSLSTNQDEPGKQ
ncbi:MAG: AraC family transcriptional regulator [Pseudomonadales bacterium]